MSLRIKFILFFGFGGILFLFVVTVLVFQRMESAMEHQLKQQFQSDVHSRMVAFDTSLLRLTEHFRSKASLPMFRSMKYHQLTANQPALKNDIRQMELYFHDLIKQRSGLSQVRYVDSNGLEVLHVEESGIRKQLTDLSQSPSIDEALNLQFGDFLITQEIVNIEIQYIVWWIPVYISPDEKSGVLGFSVEYQDILDRIGKLIVSGSEEFCLGQERGAVYLSSNYRTSCNKQDGWWGVTESIGLPGLSWELTLSVDPDSFLTEVKEIKWVVFGVIFPVVAIFAFLFVFVFSGRTVRAINQLVDVAHRIGRGEPSEPIQMDRKDELGDLAREMNQAARVIEESRNELASAKKRDLQVIMDHSSAVIHVKDMAGCYTFVNHKFEELFKVKSQHVIGKIDHDIFPREYADQFQSNDRAVLDTGKALESEEVFPQDDGIHTYFSARFPLVDEQGAMFAVCGISTDMTHRKKAEENVVSQAKLLDLIFQHTLDIVAVLDRSYDFIRVSDSYAKFCKLAVGDFVGKNYFDLCPPDLEQEISPFVNNKEIYCRSARPMEFSDHPEWGTTYWDLALVPILGKDGEIEMFLFTMKDAGNNEVIET